MAGSRKEMTLVGAVRVGLQRNEHIGIGLGTKSLRQHADYRVGIAIQGDRFAGNFGVASKVIGPQLVGKDRNLCASRPILVGRERPADERRDAKYLEVTG